MTIKQELKKKRMRYITAHNKSDEVVNKYAISFLKTVIFNQFKEIADTFPDVAYLFVDVTFDDCGNLVLDRCFLTKKTFKVAHPNQINFDVLVEAVRIAYQYDIDAMILPADCPGIRKFSFSLDLRD